MPDLLQSLAAPFDPKRISWRVGSTTKDKTKGMALAYIDSRDVQDRLDAVCGAGGWQCRYPHAGQKTVCEIGVKIDGEWVWKADGAGDSDVEAEKGALSDAFKRAAVKWGVGRYLYDLDSPWVTLEAKGSSYIIAPSEMVRLHRILPQASGTPTQPEPEAPKNAPGISKAKVWVSEFLRECNACENGGQFMELCKGTRTHWVRISGVYPNLYVGPDGSGLRGEAQKIATIMECRDEFDLFVQNVESSAEGLKQPQPAAAE